MRTANKMLNNLKMNQESVPELSQTLHYHQNHHRRHRIHISYHHHTVHIFHQHQNYKPSFICNIFICKILTLINVLRYFYATKSNGLLKPPFLFIYCLYFLFKITCTAPTSFPSTFLPFVVSNPQKPIILIISCSSGVFP